MKSQYQSFVAISQVNSQVTKSAIASQVPNHEKIKHTLIGSSKAVVGTIHVLHQLGYADVGDWSSLLPTSNPGEVMSILIRTITTY
jgi:hypothetical protein